MRELKKREDRGAISLGKIYRYKRIIYIGNLLLHEARQSCTQDPARLCHLLQIGIIAKQQANRGGPQGDRRHREFKGSLPRAAPSNRTNQRMTVPNTAGRGKREAITCPGRER